MKEASKLFFCVFLAIVMFSGCASMTGRTAGEIVDDSVITAAVNAKIVEDPQLSYLKINVNSTSGHVVLTGFVPNREAEDRLINLAREVKGVKSVESELKIEEKK
jgi:osmotically-inducible protein OsmY